MTATVEENSENSGRTALLKIDFADNAEYKKFVKDLAERVVGEMQFNDELERNVAYELAHTYMTELAEAVLEKLLAEFRIKS